MQQNDYSMQRLIGNTPIVEITKMDTGCCRLFLKLESRNITGSIKDRIATAMVDAAEKAGQIKPGGTLIEATAGNTGLALAQVAIMRGYKLLLVIPDKMSQQKIDHLRAMGVEVVITRSDVNKGHPEYYQDMAESIAKKTDNAFYVNQFDNPNNPKAHEETTGPEIWEQMGGKLDVIVSGAGTGGHVTGISRYMKRVAPHVKMVLADPKGSILADYINTGELKEGSASWLVEGIGEDFIPSTCDTSGVTEAITVNDADAFACARELLKKEGIFAGSSSGTTICAALRYCQAQKEPQNVVSFVYDAGSKYLSKMYNDDWMQSKGFKV